jgi:DNA repair exonuclease SbcCD ATPase subunit
LIDHQSRDQYLTRIQTLRVDLDKLSERVRRDEKKVNELQGDVERLLKEKQVLKEQHEQLLRLAGKITCCIEIIQLFYLFCVQLFQMNQKKSFVKTRKLRQTKTKTVRLRATTNRLRTLVRQVPVLRVHSRLFPPLVSFIDFSPVYLFI